MSSVLELVEFGPGRKIGKKLGVGMKSHRKNRRQVKNLELYAKMLCVWIMWVYPLPVK